MLLTEDLWLIKLYKMARLYLTKKERKNVSHYPIEQAVLVPSTTKANKRISITKRKARVKRVKNYLSKEFGGFTSVSAHGGYYSKKKGYIQEPVTVVTSFATVKAHRKGRANLKKQLIKWRKKWKQESVGYAHEGDLYYF